MSANIYDFSQDHVDYDKYNMLSAAELMQIISHSDAMTTRHIDMLIHGIFFTSYHAQWGDEVMVPYEKHRAHQYNIIMILEHFTDVELSLLFNDERVHYAYRYYLNGKTGTTSSILVNCQFILYNYLLTRGVTVNIHDDALLLFTTLTTVPYDRTKIIIPLEELYTITEICGEWRRRLPNAIIFQDDWWRDLISNYDGWRNWCLQKQWFKAKDDNFRTIVKQRGEKFFSTYISYSPYKIPTDTFYTEQFTNWEYTPDYINPFQRITTDILQKIKHLILYCQGEDILKRRSPCF